MHTLPVKRPTRNWKAIHEHYGSMPLEESFSAIYRDNVWGKHGADDFYSGIGSTERFAAPYVRWLSNFISHTDARTIIDLGCGDFRVGAQLCALPIHSYVGVDIVPELIVYNQLHFGTHRVRFEHANIIEDPLPDGDVACIRQVLQHLSNAEIEHLLNNCSRYAYLVVTEDVYVGNDVIHNIDMLHGPANRLLGHSGVYLDQPPYSLNVLSVLELPRPETTSSIRSSLITRIN